LSECEHLAEELSGRLGRGEITLKRYDVVIVPLDKRIAELRAWLAALDSVPRAVVDPVVEAASREEWMERWSAATVAERRNLIRQALTNRRIVIAPAVRSSGIPKFDQIVSSSRRCATPNSRATVARLGEVAVERAEFP
jgi:negative regulator of sigma E activity